MKTLDALLQQESVYLYNWKKKEDIILSFAPLGYDNKSKLIKERYIRLWQPINILFAYYDGDSYEGDAFVLFECKGKLFEVNASHCSCEGLSDFNGEETTIDALKHRLIKGTLGQEYGENQFAKELKEFLGIN